MAILTNMNDSRTSNYSVNKTNVNSSFQGIKTTISEKPTRTRTKNEETETLSFGNLFGDIKEHVNEEGFNSISDIVNTLDLPEEYRKKATNAIYNVWLDNKFLDEKGFISRLDLIMKEMEKNNLEISPLINAFIKQNYPTMDISINEQYCKKFINYLFKKNSNFDNEKPINKLKEILFPQNEYESDLKKTANIISFIQTASKDFDFSYDTIVKNINGSEKLIKNTITSSLDGLGFDGNAIYSEGKEDELWNYIIQSNGRNIYITLKEVYPNFDNQIKNYAYENGFNINSLNIGDIIIKAGNDIPTTLKLLSKVNFNAIENRINNFKITDLFLNPFDKKGTLFKLLNNACTYTDLKNLNNFLNFIGIESISEKYKLATELKELKPMNTDEYNNLMNSIEEGTFTGGLVNPDYKNKTTTTTTTSVEQSQNHSTDGGGGHWR